MQPELEIHGQNVRPRQPTRSFFDEAASAAMPTAKPAKEGGSRRGGGGCCDRFCGRCRRKPKSPSESRIQIEPKTYFANERTYMQWFMVSIVIGGIGVTYIVSTNLQAVALGRFLLPLAIALAAYSLLVFHWRTLMLLRRQPSKTYGDRCGPTGMSLAFIAVLLWGFAITLPTVLPVPAPISALCTSRMCTQMDRCTLPVTLSTPPKQDFTPSGMTSISDSLYITSTDGRVGVINPRTSEVTVWKNFWLAPGDQTSFVGVASIADHPQHIYGVRALPSPAILEIDIAGRMTRRTFAFDLPPDSAISGLAIAPAKAGMFVAYVPARDGWVSMYNMSLTGTENTTAAFVGKFVPGTASRKNLEGLSFTGQNATKSLPTLLAQYHPGQVIIIEDKIVYVYNLTDEGQPISFNSYQAFSFGIPDVKGLAFASEKAFLVTQDDEGGRNDARVMGVVFDRHAGFGFCK